MIMKWPQFLITNLGFSGYNKCLCDKTFVISSIWQRGNHYNDMMVCTSSTKNDKCHKHAFTQSSDHYVHMYRPMVRKKKTFTKLRKLWFLPPKLNFGFLLQVICWNICMYVHKIVHMYIWLWSKTLWIFIANSVKATNLIKPSLGRCTILWGTLASQLAKTYMYIEDLCCLILHCIPNICVECTKN